MRKRHPTTGVHAAPTLTGTATASAVLLFISLSSPMLVGARLAGAARFLGHECCYSPDDCKIKEDKKPAIDKCGTVDCIEGMCVLNAWVSEKNCSHYFTTCGGDDERCTKGPYGVKGMCNGWMDDECTYEFCPGDGGGMSTMPPATTSGSTTDDCCSHDDDCKIKENGKPKIEKCGSVMCMEGKCVLDAWVSDDEDCKPYYTNCGGDDECTKGPYGVGGMCNGYANTECTYEYCPMMTTSKPPPTTTPDSTTDDCCSHDDDCKIKENGKPKIEKCGSVMCMEGKCVLDAWVSDDEDCKPYYTYCGGDDECTKGPYGMGGMCNGYANTECTYEYCPMMTSDQGETTEPPAATTSDGSTADGCCSCDDDCKIKEDDKPEVDMCGTVECNDGKCHLNAWVSDKDECEPYYTSCGNHEECTKGPFETMGMCNGYANTECTYEYCPTGKISTQSSDTRPAVIKPAGPLYGIWWYNSPKDHVPFIIPPIDDEVAAAYENCDDLKEGIKQAASYLVNEAIKNNAAFDPYFYRVEEDLVMAPALMADAAPEGGGEAKATNLEDSYDTNNQEAGVDEADLIKVVEGGKVMAASYGPSLYLIDSDTMEVLSQLKHKYDSKADEVSYSVVKPPEARRSDSVKDTPDADGAVKPPIVPEPPIPIPFEEPMVAMPETMMVDEPQQRKNRDLLSIIGPPIPQNDQPPQIQALLLDGNNLVVIFTIYRPYYQYNDPDKPIMSESPRTHVRIYDIEDPHYPSLVGSRDIGGRYVAARSIGSIGHVVTSSNLDTTFHLTGYFSRYREEYADMDKDEYIAAAKRRYPSVVDSFVERLTYELLTDPGGEKSCENIVRISSFQTGEDVTDELRRDERADLLNTFVRIVSFDINDYHEDYMIEAERVGVFTPYMKNYVYASKDVLVVPAWGRNYDPKVKQWRDSTLVWAFALSDDGSAARKIGVAKVKGRTTMPGSIDQFSFDEYDGLLRVATTNREIRGCLEWKEDYEFGPRCMKYGVITNSTSQITVLELPDTSDEYAKPTVLKEISVIENLGVTEQIFAVRFMDDKAFVVTFRRTDPFYSIDFSNPRDPNPPIGELANITGFSNYLHPFDVHGDVILAVGEEADRTGRAMGLQVSLFDTSDLKSPRLMHKYYEGKGASSNAQQDHKAFRFVRRTDDSKSGVLIIPVREYTYNVPNGRNFDGFRLYDVSLDKGIKPLFDVSHATSYDIVYGCWFRTSSLPPRSFLVGGGRKLITSKRHSLVKTDLETEDAEWVLTMASKIKHTCNYYW